MYILAIIAVFILGVSIQLFLMFRSWIHGDQIILLKLGLGYAKTGELAPISKFAPGGAPIPGCLLQLLIGLPLRIWPDYRAPVALIGLFHVISALLLVSIILRQTGVRLTLVFLIVYWLSPWRLYHSGFVWEPSFLFLPAAIHFWSVWKLMDRANLGASAGLTAILVLTSQLHGSFLILVILTLLLYIRKSIRINAAGALLGVVIGAIPLIPTIMAITRGSLHNFLPTQSFIGRGLVTVYPVLRGILYWFRLGSLDIGRRLRHVIFLDSNWIGDDPARRILQFAVIVLYALTVITIILSLAASWWFFRRKRPECDLKESWNRLHSYAFNCFLAVVISSAFSPVTIQGWHVVIALHAASIPLACWITEKWTKWRRLMQWAIVIFLLLRVPEIIVIGYGNDSFRKKPFTDSESSQITEQLERILPENLLKND